MPNKKYAFKRSDISLLGSITQVVPIMLELKKKKLITKFSWFPGQDKSALTYRIFFTEYAYFIVKLFFASFHPHQGATFDAKSSGWQLTILVDKNSQNPASIADVVKSLIETKIEEHRKGIETEKLFAKNVGWLIENDPEVSRVIRGLRKSGLGSYDDIINKKDFFFILVDSKKEPPVQIKTGEFGKKTHERVSDVPTINLTTIKNMDELKKHILDICKNFI